MGRRHDARIERLPSVGADAARLAGLEHAQELRLEFHGELANLVEEQGSPVSLLEDPSAIAVGAGEGALHESEELRLDERGRDGAAIEDHKRSLPSWARVVNGAREELLARARLSDEKNRLLGGRSDLQPREEGAHHQRPSDRLPEAGGARERQFSRRASHPQRETPLPYARDDARSEHRLLDLQLPDEGAVLAVEIAKPHAGVAQCDRAMPARDMRVVDHDVALRAGPHDQRIHSQRRDGLGAVGSGHAQLERRDRDGVVPDTRHRVRRIVRSLRHRGSS